MEEQTLHYTRKILDVQRTTIEKNVYLDEQLMGTTELKVENLCSDTLELTLAHSEFYRTRNQNIQSTDV
jgi:hypothetical protein